MFGIVVDEVVFDGEAPDISRLSERISEMSGLSVSIRKTEDSDLYILHGYLNFTCKPDTEIEVTVFQPAAIKNPFDEVCRLEGVVPPKWLTESIAGMNEQPEKQTVHLRGYADQEGTLIAITKHALESLGGVIRHPMDEEARLRYSKKITESELEERNWKLTFKILPALFVCALLAPLWLPLSLFGDTSRRRMNDQLKRAHQALSLKGEPEQISVFQYCWVMVQGVPMLCLLVGGAILYALYLPFSLLIAAVRHMYFKIKR